MLSKLDKMWSNKKQLQKGNEKNGGKKGANNKKNWPQDQIKDHR